MVRSGILKVVLEISKDLLGSEGEKRSMLVQCLGQTFNTGSSETQLETDVSKQELEEV